MGSNKQIKKKKSHLKVSKSKKKSGKHSKKKLKSLKNGNEKQSPSLNPTTCPECHNSLHTSLKCPKIWRRYVLKEKKRITHKMVLPIHTIYCYRCGAKGHYGDDCDMYTESKHLTTEGSAFSGQNLERPLSDMYYNIIQKQREDAGSVKNNNIPHRKLKIFPFYPPPYATTGRIK